MNNLRIQRELKLNILSKSAYNAPLKADGKIFLSVQKPYGAVKNFVVYKLSSRVKISNQKMKEFSVGGHCVSRPPTLRGERSRPRGGLTLPKSSGSGNEQITSQKAAPQGLKTNIMTNKITHARSDKNKNVIEGVELKTKLAQTYLSELDNISSEQEALYWARGVPMEIARTLFLLVALKKTKRRVQIV